MIESFNMPGSKCSRGNPGPDLWAHLGSEARMPTDSGFQATVADQGFETGVIIVLFQFGGGLIHYGL